MIRGGRVGVTMGVEFFFYIGLNRETSFKNLILKTKGTQSLTLEYLEKELKSFKIRCTLLSCLEIFFFDTV